MKNCPRITISNQIINNWTLQITNNQINEEYRQKFFNFPKFIFISILLVISTIFIVITAFSWTGNNAKSTTLLIDGDKILAVVTLFKAAINLIIIIIAKLRNDFRSFIIPIISILNFSNITFVFYLAKIFADCSISNNPATIFDDTSVMIVILILLEGFSYIYYIFFIDSNYFYFVLANIFSIIITPIFESSRFEYNPIILCSSLALIIFYLPIIYVINKEKVTLYIDSIVSETDLKNYKNNLKGTRCILTTFHNNVIIYCTKKKWSYDYAMKLFKIKREDICEYFDDIIRLGFGPFKNKYYSDNSHWSNRAKLMTFTKLENINESLDPIIKENILAIKNEVDKRKIMERTETIFASFIANKMNYRIPVLIAVKKYYCGIENRDMSLAMYVTLRVEEKNGVTETFIDMLGKEIDPTIISEEHNAQIRCTSLFASKITHEIKNPLLALQELLKSNRDYLISSKNILKVPEEVEKNFEMAGHYVDFMMILIKDFEFFAKNIAGNNPYNNTQSSLTKDHSDNRSKYTSKEMQVEFNYEWVNIKDMFCFCIALMKSISKSKNSIIPLNLIFPNDFNDLIYTDQLRIKQIIINLLSNSLKFTKYGEINLICENDDENYIKITVQDTGVGIKTEDQHNLASPFNKLAHKNVKNQYGAGLGLSIVKELVEYLGKNFDIKSEDGKGTTITFLLPKKGQKENILFDNQDENSISAENISDNNLYQDSTTKTLLSEIKHMRKSDSFLSLKEDQQIINKTVNKKASKQSLKELETLRKNFEPNKFNIADSVILPISYDTLEEESEFYDEINEDLQNYKLGIKKQTASPKYLGKRLSKFSHFSNCTDQMPKADFLDKRRESSEIYLNFPPIFGGPTGMLSKKSLGLKSPEINRRASMYGRHFKNKKHSRTKTNLCDCKKTTITKNIKEFHCTTIPIETKCFINISNNDNCVSYLNPHQIPFCKNPNTNFVSQCNPTPDFFILIVEDDNYIRKSQIKLITKYCEMNNLKVQTDECIDGAECLFKMFNSPVKYSAVITDESMKFIEGKMLSFVIKILIRERKLDPIKIFLSSSYNNIDPDIEYLGEKVYDGTYNKPVTIKDYDDIFDIMKKI